MSSSPQLRVLLSPSAYYPHVGGIEELTRQLARELSGRGHEVLVLTNRWPAGTSSAERIDGVDVRRLSFELPRLRVGRFAAVAPRTAFELRALVREFRPDVFHAIGAGPNVAWLTALRVSPLVFTAQGEYGFDPHGAFRRSRPLRAGLRRALRSAAAVTACSEYVLAELAGDFELRSPVVVVPNGVRPEEFDLPKPAPNGLGRYVFAGARLVRGKGLDVLVRSVASAGDALGGRRLVIAGEGPERASLERLVRELRVDATFLGPLDRERLPLVLAGADAFALPSRGEPFGIALLEAMAAGVPAAATRAGGVPEFAEDGRNALLVPPDHEAGLADALVRLVRDEELRGRLAEGGRETAARFAWPHVADRYESVYRSVVRA